MALSLAICDSPGEATALPAQLSLLLHEVKPYLSTALVRCSRLLRADARLRGRAGDVRRHAAQGL